MAWNCISCKYQKHAKHQEGKIRHLEQELKAAREEISRLKAGNVSSGSREQGKLETWIKPKNSKSRCRGFSANDAPQVHLNNRFIVLETDTLYVGQQSPVLLKHESREVKSFAGKSERKRKVLLLGSSHGRDIGSMLKENLSNKFYIVNIFKPNAPLGKVEDLGKLGKGLTKQDHIVIVGGPDNSLDRNHYYSVEKDDSFIAERTANTNVGFVNLFSRHDKPWMNKRVRRVNLQLDRALGVIDTASLVRDDYTANGLHLNSLGKRRLMHLIAQRISGGHVSSVSSIPVITHARALPSLA
jgi:hypothetical protein